MIQLNKSGQDKYGNLRIINRLFITKYLPFQENIIKIALATLNQFTSEEQKDIKKVRKIILSNLKKDFQLNIDSYNIEDKVFNTKNNLSNNKGKNIILKNIDLNLFKGDILLQIKFEITFISNAKKLSYPDIFSVLLNRVNKEWFETLYNQYDIDKLNNLMDKIEGIQYKLETLNTELNELMNISDSPLYIQ